MTSGASDARLPDSTAFATPADGAAMPLMARLKVRTRDQHDALHRHGALSLLVRPRLAPSSYRSILEVFDAFLVAAEAQVLVPADDGLAAGGFRRASRRPDLARDIKDLAAAGVPPPPGGPPAPPALRVPAGQGGALGVLYVLEGSRLGGQGLARRVGSSLPHGLGGATRFLGSPGLDVAAHWQRVGQVINTLGKEPGVAEEACVAARDVFCLLADLFDEVP
ncbi:biliverdin-producing heme oxygenase [Roseospira visakhapatnamensis]|uniref:Heme oxygenase n=1 Tax=Roseospira visakhapatnamensis TaxID=390880 RepID=A0A7W6RCE4_9PROT|nr:biliverdin-producing heme oxygenase [Roseospira visakhapatnamensis]MBB4265424.1 heme oxygenase [Roseospira visakhapatnamensis]